MNQDFVFHVRGKIDDISAVQKGESCLPFTPQSPTCCWNVRLQGEKSAIPLKTQHWSLNLKENSEVFSPFLSFLFTYFSESFYFVIPLSLSA